jgi:hypothetical protein
VICAGDPPLSQQQLKTCIFVYQQKCLTMGIIGAYNHQRLMADAVLLKKRRRVPAPLQGMFMNYFLFRSSIL